MSKFVPVVSAAITAVKFDRESGRLFVNFSEDLVYEYDGVPGDVVLDFMFADSIGGTFDALVKKGEFSFKRVPLAEANA